MYSGAVVRNGWHLDRDEAEAAEADASTRSVPRSFQWHFTETILEKNVFLWNVIWRFMAIYGDLWWIHFLPWWFLYIYVAVLVWLCDGSKLVGYSVGVIIPWKIWKIKHSSNCSNQQPCLASVRHGKHKEVRQITSTPFGQSHSHQGELCFLKTDGYTITKLVTASQGVYCLPFSTVATNRSDPLSTYVATWLPENIRKLNLKSTFISDGVQCLHKSTTGPPYSKNSKMLSLDNCHDLT